MGIVSRNRDRPTRSSHREASPSGFGTRLAAKCGTEHDVFQASLPRQQRILLKHVCGFMVDRSQLPASRNNTAGRRFQETRDQIQHRGFAATRRPDDRYKLSSRNLK